MSCEGLFTIDLMGKGRVQSHLGSQFCQLAAQDQMQLASFRKAEWVLSDEKHRVLVKGSGKLWCGLSFFLSLWLVVLAAGRAVCALQNIRSSWWMVTPLRFYFFLLGTVGASLGKGFSFQWLFFAAGSEEKRRKEAFSPLFFMLTLHLLYWRAKSSCPWLSLNISLGHTDFLSLQLSVSLYRAPRYLD